jgi:hypothetical protein
MGIKSYLGEDLLGDYAADPELEDLLGRWVPASSAAPSSLAFAEDTDNGVHTVTVTAPSAVTADAVATLPDATGTVALIDDTAYGPSWNGVTTKAPTQNAVYDKIETLAGGWVNVFAPTTLAEWSTSGANWTDPGGGVIQNVGTGQYIYKDLLDVDLGVAQRITGEFQATSGPGTNTLMSVAPLHAASALAGGDLDIYVMGTGSIFQDRKGVTNIHTRTGTAIAVDTWYTFEVTYNGLLSVFSANSKISAAIWTNSPTAAVRVIIGAANGTSQTVQFRNLRVDALRPT